jgi:hypothetical protein
LRTQFVRYAYYRSARIVLLFFKVFECLQSIPYRMDFILCVCIAVTGEDWWKKYDKIDDKSHGYNLVRSSMFTSPFIYVVFFRIFCFRFHKRAKWSDGANQSIPIKNNTLVYWTALYCKHNRTRHAT